MSEYIEIETEMAGDPDVMLFHTNLRLIDWKSEEYESTEMMEEGSAMQIGSPRSPFSSFRKKPVRVPVPTGSPPSTKIYWREVDD